MFELKKVCDTFETLSAAERELLLTKKSAVVLEKLRDLSIPDMKAANILVGFIIGAITADGRIDETEYLLIYPALVRTFGDDFDFRSIKDSFRYTKDQKKMLANYVDEMIYMLSLLNDDLKRDVITLCLCVISIDRTITLKEKRYIRRLYDTM